MICVFFSGRMSGFRRSCVNGVDSESPENACVSPKLRIVHDGTALSST